MRTIVLLLALLLPVSAQANLAFSIRALVDKPVLSTQGDSLGVLKAVAVNVNTGEAPWAVMLTGTNLVAIPTTALVLAQPGLLTSLMTPEEFLRAPRWRSDQLALMIQAQAIERIARTYGQRNDPQRPATIHLVGSNLPWPPGEAGVVRVLGDRVMTLQGVAIGTIVDLLVELKTGRARLVAVEADDKRSAIPFSHLFWQPNAGSFVTNMPRGELKRLPRADWPEGEAVAVAP